MKNYILLISLLLPISVIAQQDIILTKYSFNSLFFNPATAGNSGEEQGSVILNYRDQWLGLEGSPTTILLGGEANLFRDRVGLGLTLSRESIGVDSRTDVVGNYAYRMKIQDNYLAFGLRTGLHFYNSALSDIRATDQQDDLYDNGDITFNLFTVGAGVYYYMDHFYAGFSVPAIATVSGNRSGYKTRHYYLHTGAIFSFSEYSEMQLEPSILVKYEPASPTQLTIGAKLWIINEFNVGAHYRSGDSFALSSDFVIAERLTLGVAYDFTTSELRDSTSGTAELLVAYKFSYQNDFIPMGRR